MPLFSNFAADGIDEAVMMFADFMKDSQLRRVEMSYCVGLSPLHIAAICKSVQSLNTLEELIISSVSMVRVFTQKELNCQPKIDFIAPKL